jgi:hypothetical protein
MNRRRPAILLSTALVLVAVAIAGWLRLPVLARPVQRGATPAPTAAGQAGTAARAVTAANTFLGTLGAAERAKAAFPFDSPQKSNWSNLPTGAYQRHSLRLGDLAPAQHDAAMALMAVVLSREGYQKAVDIMNADEYLRNNPGRGRQGGGRGGQGGPAAQPAPPAPAPQNPPPAGAPPRGGGGRGGGANFGLAEFYIAILGAPSVTTPWMVQFGGHHLALNVTIAGGSHALTPSLPAAQPATYTLNGQSIRPLGDENDKGFALINALDAKQQAQAILPSRVTDLVLGAGQDGKTIQPEGLLASAMAPAQQTMLLDLAHEWVGILNDEGAAARMAEIRSNLARTYFAWSGPTTAGSVAYYRIQGPTVVIEYAPQNSVDHVHTIYRDPTNDYGARLVKP